MPTKNVESVEKHVINHDVYKKVTPAPKDNDGSKGLFHFVNQHTQLLYNGIHASFRFFHASKMKIFELFGSCYTNGL